MSSRNLAFAVFLLFLVLTLALSPASLFAADSCTGVNVITDPAGDAVNPAPGAQGPTSQADITAVSFSANATTLTTTMKIVNLTQIASPGSTFTSYYVVWTSSDGKAYGTEVDVDAATISYFWGLWDSSNNQLSTFNTVTGTFTTGANGTITVPVPRSSIGSPIIPIADPNGTAAVSSPFAYTIAGEGVLGAGLVFPAFMDRAPNSGSGSRAFVCVSQQLTPTATTLTSAPNSSNAGQAVTFTASVIPATATGSVNFLEGASTLGSGTLNASGQATFTTSSLSAGTHSIVAAYLGDSNFASSTSSAVTQIVNPLQSAMPPPRFDILMSPTGIGDGWGEPSIGVNWRSEKSFSNNNPATNNPNLPIPNGGTLMSYGGFGGGANITNLGATALRITTNDCPSPALATWEKTSTLTLAGSPRVYGDPILFTDRATGRTFVSQLIGLSPAGSGTDITDDDGRTYQPSQGSNLPSDVDHQTVGGGPFHAPLTGGTPRYPNAIYYAAQSIGEARAALSVDGGVTFGPGTLMYTNVDCGGLHGHLKVAPDGTVYVANNACGGTVSPADPFGHKDGMQAVIVSEDNGATWTIRKIPGSTTKSDHDPSVGVSNPTDPVTRKGEVIYVGMQSADGHPRIAVSRDKGATWSVPFDVGASVINGGPVLNTAFPAVVAGDPNRAAFAFYGTERGGDDYNTAGFAGIWYLYVASTFDRGLTWTTQNVTPGDPIQRGGICGSGACRNLLDFFDASIDKEGRVVVGYEDGCIGGCVSGPPNSFTAKNAIARQRGGNRMFAAFDPVEPNVPKAPFVTANFDITSGNIVHVFWTTPDDSGSRVTGYNVYRRTGTTGTFVLIANVTGNSFDDTNIVPNTAYLYHVTAVNGIGEGPYCLDVAPILPPPPPNPCQTPGVVAVNDLNPDGTDNDADPNTPPDPRVNIKRLSVAEPFSGGLSKLIFTLQMATSTNTTAPPNSQWFIIWNRPKPDADFDRWYVAMKSDAASAVSFEYGKFGVPLPIGGVPSPNANQPVKVGDADSGSYNVTTGVITITLSTSKAENVQAGNTLNALNVRTFFVRPDAGIRSQAIASDITTDGSYTLVGNAFCRTNTAPIAVLTATPASGPAPLTVNFSGAGSSDPDTAAPPDTIASYTFDFGDGSAPVTQASPTTSHTYQAAGTYTATLSVTDSRGKASAKTSTQTITVTGGTAAGPTVSSVSAGPLCQGSGNFTITVNGTNFVSGSVVQVNGTNRTTNFASSTQLTATVLASDVSSSRTFTVRVVNPDGSMSNTVTVTVPLLGDLNLDNLVNVVDLNIMANYLAGNVSPGTAPFTAPLSAADLNRDTKVDAVDLTILAHYLAGNITCLPTN